MAIKLKPNVKIYKTKEGEVNEYMSCNVVDYDFFIIPNPTMQLKKEWVENPESGPGIVQSYDFVWKQNCFTSTFAADLDNEVSELYQIWIADPRDEEHESNLVDGPVPEDHAEMFDDVDWPIRFPSRAGKRSGACRLAGFIPGQYIYDLKEGETLHFVYTTKGGNNIQINLTAAQEKYRYKRFGKFEEVVQKLRQA